jgi:hypothetical protein
MSSILAGAQVNNDILLAPLYRDISYTSFGDGAVIPKAGQAGMQPPDSGRRRWGAAVGVYRQWRVDRLCLPGGGFGNRPARVCAPFIDPGRGARPARRVAPPGPGGHSPESATGSALSDASNRSIRIRDRSQGVPNAIWRLQLVTNIPPGSQRQVSLGDGRADHIAA